MEVTIAKLTIVELRGYIELFLNAIIELAKRRYPYVADAPGSEHYAKLEDTYSICLEVLSNRLYDLEHQAN